MTKECARSSGPREPLAPRGATLAARRLRRQQVGSSMTSTNAQSQETKSTNDRSRVVTAVFLGAILGGVWGWLYLTSRGAKARGRVDPAVDRIVDALEKVQTVRAVVKSLAVLVLVVASAHGM